MKIENGHYSALQAILMDNKCNRLKFRIEGDHKLFIGEWNET